MEPLLRCLGEFSRCGQDPSALHPDLAKIHRRKVEAWREVLLAPATRDAAFDLPGPLDGEVRLVSHTGDLRIGIGGELAGILELRDAGFASS